MNILENPPRKLTHVRAAIYGQPWAITDSGFKQMLAIAEAHTVGGEIKFDAASQSGAGNDDPGFDLVNDVAVIPVRGMIFPKANLMTRFSGAVSLESLKTTIETVLSIKPTAAIMNLNTPGGSVDGLADFCEWLYGTVQSCGFPFVGLVNPLCGSAGYMIASQLDALDSTSGGFSGSIGIISQMDNTERAERNAGNDPVILRTHELKGIGFGATTPNQIGELQRMMMAHMGKFQEAVQRGRPNVDINAVSTGQVWHGKSANADPSALDMGLIDGVSTLEKLIAEYGKA